MTRLIFRKSVSTHVFPLYLAPLYTAGMGTPTSHGHPPRSPHPAPSGLSPPDNPQTDPPYPFDIPTFPAMPPVWGIPTCAWSLTFVHGYGHVTYTRHMSSIAATHTDRTTQAKLMPHQNSCRVKIRAKLIATRRHDPKGTLVVAGPGEDRRSWGRLGRSGWSLTPALGSGVTGWRRDIHGYIAIIVPL